MVILPPVTLHQPKVSSLHNRSHFPLYKSYLSPCKKLVKYCRELFVLMLELDWFWTYDSSDLLTNAASSCVCLHLVRWNIVLQLLHLQHQHGIKIVFVNQTTITYNLVSKCTLLEIRAHFEPIKIVSIYTLLEIWVHFECIKIKFIKQTTITYNLLSICTLLEIRAHFEHIKIVFIKQMTITYNLVSIYTLLEIRVHFECIKIVFIKQTIITCNLVSIYTLLEIWVHFECINNIGMVWGTERD